MSYYRPVFKEDTLNEITSPDYIATEYVFNRQSLNDLTHGYPVFVNSKVRENLGQQMIFFCICDFMLHPDCGRHPEVHPNFSNVVIDHQEEQDHTQHEEAV